MSNWLSVFGRDYSVQDPCIENLYGVCLDGVDDFLANGGGALQPDGSGASKQWVSIWLKDMDTAAKNTAEFIFTQSVSGNNSADFWRIVYNTNNSSGSPLNVITVEWRANGSSNRILKQYRLHENTTVTGSTSSTDFWLGNNPNINMNSDGYVHLFAIWDVPQIGNNMNTGDVQLYWNGQIMSTAYNISKVGTSQTSIFNNTSLCLGTNYYNTAGFWKGQMDEVFITNLVNGSVFMSDKGLTTNGDVAQFLYNNGCPGNIGSDNRWNFNWWRFENSWNADSGSNAWSPINGPTFGSFPNGCSFAAAALSCTTNTLLKPSWHPQWPKTTSSSNDVKSYISSDFTVGPSATWSTTVADGYMSWLAIGFNTAGGSPSSTSELYTNSEYWIRMDRQDGDGNGQNNPSVAGGTANPNVLYLEEKDSTGALTGNSVTFQCIEDATSITFGQEFIFKAKVTAQTGFGTDSVQYTYPTGPSNLTEWCVTWSSTTPLVTCGPATGLTAENVYAEDFGYSTTVPTGGGGGQPIGGF